MNKNITIDNFIELVKKREIKSKQSVNIISDTLLDLIKEKLELEIKVEKLESEAKSSEDDLKYQIRKLEFLLEDSKNENTRLKSHIINLQEHEKIQRQRANEFKDRLKCYQDTDFSYTVVGK